MKTLKEMIQNKTVQFVRYQKGDLWYVTECGFEFPVPITDTGDGAFVAKDKASFFMRWIRKQMDSINEGKQLQENI